MPPAPVSPVVSICLVGRPVVERQVGPVAVVEGRPPADAGPGQDREGLALWAAQVGDGYALICKEHPVLGVRHELHDRCGKLVTSITLDAAGLVGRLGARAGMGCARYVTMTPTPTKKPTPRSGYHGAMRGDEGKTTSALLTVW